MPLKTFLAALSLIAALSLGAAHAQDPAAVNINQAGAQELADALVGIGLRRAQAIIEYRDAFGPFQDAYELVNVSGVGERTVALNEARIRIK